MTIDSMQQLSGYLLANGDTSKIDVLFVEPTRWNFEDLQDFTKVKELYITNAYLEPNQEPFIDNFLNDGFEWDRLELLSLHECELKKIPEFIFKNKTIKYLILTSNKIAEVDERIKQLTHIEHIDISGNKISGEEVQKLLPNCYVEY